MDVDECATNTDDCHENAICTNTIGSFECACKNGYGNINVDDPDECLDLNECLINANSCGNNANCTNTDGS